MTAAPLTSSRAPARGGIVDAAALGADEVLHDLGVERGGLTSAEARIRLDRWGPNAVSTHRARFLPVLWHQLRSPLLALLLVAAVASYFVGQRTDALIIGRDRRGVGRARLRQRVPRGEGG